MIQLNEITKIYRTDEVETLAVNKLNLSIGENEFVAMMGPSGCGKSTLLNIIGLLDKPSSGNYQLNGEETTPLNVAQKADRRKNLIGFVFQNFNLIEELNVFHNVELPLLYQPFSRKERKEKVNQVLERVGIGHRAKHFPPQLSGGQQQRVAVARALVADPKIILADEPTGNLDSKNGSEVLDLLSELHQQGTTIIMVTHSKYDAERSQRIIQLMDGKVISENGH